MQAAINGLSQSVRTHLRRSTAARQLPTPLDDVRRWLQPVLLSCAAFPRDQLHPLLAVEVLQRLASVVQHRADGLGEPRLTLELGLDGSEGLALSAAQLRHSTVQMFQPLKSLLRQQAGTASRGHAAALQRSAVALLCWDLITSARVPDDGGPAVLESILDLVPHVAAQLDRPMAENTSVLWRALLRLLLTNASVRHELMRDGGHEGLALLVKQLCWRESVDPLRDPPEPVVGLDLWMDPVLLGIWCTRIRSTSNAAAAAMLAEAHRTRVAETSSGAPPFSTLHLKSASVIQVCSAQRFRDLLLRLAGSVVPSEAREMLHRHGLLPLVLNVDIRLAMTAEPSIPASALEWLQLVSPLHAYVDAILSRDSAPQGRECGGCGSAPYHTLQLSFAAVSSVLTALLKHFHRVGRTPEGPAILLANKARIHRLHDTIARLHRHVSCVEGPQGDPIFPLTPAQAKENICREMLFRSRALVRRVMNLKNEAVSSALRGIDSASESRRGATAVLSSAMTDAHERGAAQGVADPVAVLRNHAHRVLEPQLAVLYDRASVPTNARREAGRQLFLQTFQLQSEVSLILASPSVQEPTGIAEGVRLLTMRILLHQFSDAASCGCGDGGGALLGAPLRQLYHAIGCFANKVHRRVGPDGGDDDALSVLCRVVVLLRLCLLTGATLAPRDFIAAHSLSELRSIASVPLPPRGPLEENTIGSQELRLLGLKQWPAPVLCRGGETSDPSFACEYDGAWEVKEQLGDGGPPLGIADDVCAVYRALHKHEANGRVDSVRLVVPWSVVASAREPLRLYDEDGSTQQRAEYFDYALQQLRGGESSAAVVILSFEQELSLRLGGALSWLPY